MAGVLCLAFDLLFGLRFADALDLADGFRLDFVFDLLLVFADFADLTFFFAAICSPQTQRLVGKLAMLVKIVPYTNYLWKLWEVRRH